MDATDVPKSGKSRSVDEIGALLLSRSCTTCGRLHRCCDLIPQLGQFRLCLAALSRVLARAVRLRLIFKFAHRHRAAEQIALRKIHAERLHPLELLWRLHT